MCLVDTIRKGCGIKSKKEKILNFVNQANFYLDKDLSLVKIYLNKADNLYHKMEQDSKISTRLGLLKINYFERIQEE